MSTFRITQVRSTIGRTQDQRAMVRTLGLKRIHQTVTQPDRPEIRGILNRIPHLVEWELVDDDTKAASSKADKAASSKGDKPAALEIDTTAAPEADDSES